MPTCYYNKKIERTLKTVGTFNNIEIGGPALNNIEKFKIGARGALNNIEKFKIGGP